MSVTSILVRDGYGAVASQYKSDSNCYGISASGTHYFPSEGRYQTQGFHYGEFPGANPLNYMVSTNSRWVDYEDILKIFWGCFLFRPSLKRAFVIASGLDFPRYIYKYVIIKTMSILMHPTEEIIFIIS